MEWDKGTVTVTVTETSAVTVTETAAVTVTETAAVTVYTCRWEREISSHELLRLAVGRYCGCDLQEITVVVDAPFGKPSIRELPEVYFSISHSGEFWVCAVGESEVGLDLQKDVNKNTEKLAQRFFHRTEVQWLKQHGWENFTRMWALKESYVKYTGAGLTKGLDYFSVVEGLDAVQQILPFFEGYELALTQGRRTEVRLEELDWRK